MKFSAFECMWLLRLTPHNPLTDFTWLTNWTVKSFFSGVLIREQSTIHLNLNFISLLWNWFSYLLLFRTWLRVTRTRRPWSRAVCTPLGPPRWRSHHRKPSPTLHCKTLQPSPRSVSSSPRLDVAGSPACQSLTGQSMAPTCIGMLTRGRGLNLSAAWRRVRIWSRGT